ncbi:hypothetical protein QBC39DRAFT_268349 [Podospora conica]|nr:hypothetical protein QBC39DRAFT_268349 [Schizothecium conicum]
MCWFDQTKWNCGYWKWGSFREQCEKEHRMGETCGLKLINDTTRINGDCKICDQIRKKQRRVEKMKKDIQRWQYEGNRWATIDKTNEDIAEIDNQIDDLFRTHEMRKHGLS